MGGTGGPFQLPSLSRGRIGASLMSVSPGDPGYTVWGPVRPQSLLPRIQNTACQGRLCRGQKSPEEGLCLRGKKLVLTPVWMLIFEGFWGHSVLFPGPQFPCYENSWCEDGLRLGSLHEPGAAHGPLGIIRHLAL